MLEGVDLGVKLMREEVRDTKQIHQGGENGFLTPKEEVKKLQVLT